MRIGLVPRPLVRYTAAFGVTALTKLFKDINNDSVVHGWLVPFAAAAGFALYNEYTVAFSLGAYLAHVRPLSLSIGCFVGTSLVRCGQQDPALASGTLELHMRAPPHVHMGFPGKLQASQRIPS